MSTTEGLPVLTFGREEQLLNAIPKQGLTSGSQRRTLDAEWKARFQEPTSVSAVARSAEAEYDRWGRHGFLSAAGLTAPSAAPAEQPHAIRVRITDYLRRPQRYRRSFLERVEEQLPTSAYAQRWQQRPNQLCGTIGLGGYASRANRTQSELPARGQAVSAGVVMGAEPVNAAGPVSIASRYFGSPRTAKRRPLTGAHDPCPQFTVSSDGMIRSANGAAMALFSENASDSPARAGSSLADVLPGLVPAWVEFLRDDVPDKRVDAEITAAGQRNWFEARLRRGEGTEAEQAETAVTLWEITHRRIAEDAARLESVRRLAGGVAHEFNNILASMRLCADLALIEQEPASYCRLAELVIRLADRGAEMTRDLMQLGPPTGEAASYVAVDQPIHDALASVHDDLVQAKIQVKMQGHARGEQVRGRRDRLERVFRHLVVNALHAMPGGGTLSIVVRVLPTRGTDYREVAVSVSDTGIGISAASLRHVFEPFYTTKGRLAGSDVPGTGLGLSVSLAIVRAYGGDIGLSSIEGGGTTAEVRLPGPCVRKPSDSSR